MAGNLTTEEKPGWAKAAEAATIALDEEYFPMMCSSGAENYLAEYPENLYHEVEALAQTCSHIALAFPSTELATKLRQLLMSLAPPEDKYPPLTYSPNQLDLPFSSEEHDG